MKGRMLRTTRAIATGAIASLSCVAAFPAGAEVTVAQLKNLYGADLEVLGDVQQIDVTHDSLIVAGQHVAIAKKTTFSFNGVAVSDATHSLRTIQLGDMLAISGEVGLPAVSITRLKDEYVAGATT
jgi:hypothetical protein